MKSIIVGFCFVFAFLNTAFAATLNLESGESAVIQANTSTRVTCNGHSSPVGGDAQCYQENADLKIQINQLQNDLYYCQMNNQKPKIWNCTYVCGGNNGMGSDTSKAAACRAAKEDSGVMCSAQCECEQE